MYTLTFKVENQPLDIKCQVEAGENVLRAAQRAGIEIDAPCAGNGTCGKCRVRLVSGALDMPQNPRLSYVDYEEMWRLACQSKVIGDAVVWVPATASAFKEDIATADLSTPEELERYEKATDTIFSSGLSRTQFEDGCGIAVDIGTTTVTAALLDLKTGKVLSKASR
ncbi:MAG: 2Fe-2S iron-sulfur cluster binding domain-containing protein, partial [Oscillospiraceae bacterium]|nr:2Fe-2S iron-sulfur cluster binding domain-containing protein [Oscillospiraceae bacterium]